MFWNTVLKILEAILIYIFVLIGVILAIPFVVIGMILYLPVDAVSETWGKKSW